MAISDTQSCNVALGQIGVGRIANIDGASQVERDCKSIYADARDEVLADFDWPFARKKAELSQIAVGPEFDFSYAYQLPADYLAARNLYGRETRYEIVGDQLHCDLEADCFLTYTGKITNPVLFTSKFVTALAARLSASLANSVKKTHSVSMDWWSTYYTLLPSLEADDARGEDVELSSSNPFVESR